MSDRGGMGTGRWWWYGNGSMMPDGWYELLLLYKLIWLMDCCIAAGLRMSSYLRQGERISPINISESFYNRVNKQINISTAFRRNSLPRDAPSIEMRVVSSSFILCFCEKSVQWKKLSWRTTISSSSSIDPASECALGQGRSAKQET